MNPISSEQQVAKNPIGEFTILMDAFCSCGWKMTQSEDGSFVCENAECPEMGTLYRPHVVMTPTVVAKI